MNFTKSFGVITVALIMTAALLAGGCAPKSGSVQKDNMADWEWVPSVWVNNSFTGSQYSNCFYDQYSNGYLCPPGTK